MQVPPSCVNAVSLAELAAFKPNIPQVQSPADLYEKSRSDRRIVSGFRFLTLRSISNPRFMIADEKRVGCFALYIPDSPVSRFPSWHRRVARRRAQGIIRHICCWLIVRIPQFRK
jgi:hypothetical protein